MYIHIRIYVVYGGYGVRYGGEACGMVWYVPYTMVYEKKSIDDAKCLHS
jgi:hypothetical protein